MQPISYSRHRYPVEVIRQAVWVYLRFIGDVEELPAEPASTSQMRALNAGSAQRFLSAPCAVYNTFNLWRHLVSRRNMLRAEAA